MAVVRGTGIRVVTLVLARYDWAHVGSSDCGTNMTCRSSVVEGALAYAEAQPR